MVILVLKNRPTTTFWSDCSKLNKSAFADLTFAFVDISFAFVDLKFAFVDLKFAYVDLKLSLHEVWLQKCDSKRLIMSTFFYLRHRRRQRQRKKCRRFFALSTKEKNVNASPKSFKANSWYF